MFRISGDSQHEDQRDGFSKAGRHGLIQFIITKDNVSISIDASVYYRRVNARFSHYRIQSVNAAIAEITYAILKNTCGLFILQDLLEKRQDIADDLERQVDKYVREWGVEVTVIKVRCTRSSSRISSSARTYKNHSQAQLRRDGWLRARS